MDNEIEILNEIISNIENQIKYYEDLINSSKNWRFYDSFGEPLENAIRRYKTMLEVLIAKRERLITIRDSKNCTLIYMIRYEGRLQCQY